MGYIDNNADRSRDNKKAANIDTQLVYSQSMRKRDGSSFKLTFIWIFNKHPLIMRTPQIILTDVRYLDQRTGKCDLSFYCFSIIFVEA